MLLYCRGLLLHCKTNNNNAVRYCVISCWSPGFRKLHGEGDTNSTIQKRSCCFTLRVFLPPPRVNGIITVNTNNQRSFLLSVDPSGGKRPEHLSSFSSGPKRKNAHYFSHLPRLKLGRKSFMSTSLSVQNLETCFFGIEKSHPLLFLSHSYHRCRLFSSSTTADTRHYCKKNISRPIYTTTNNNAMEVTLIEEKYDCNGNKIETGKEHAVSSYEDAVKALNSLQMTSKKVTLSKEDRKIYDCAKLDNVRKYIEFIGMMTEDLDQLSVIHIAGTKGKGSTCSYVESILRHKGYKTGFFSSPHLKEVRERIRINGTPISREKFTEYFWHCFTHLQANCTDICLPTFFQFLTVLCFYVFWKEKVQVCVLEVGLGGRYDCTNIVKNPVVCGITHLGMDHTNVLGNTIQSIAGHKAGIFKPKTSAVTSPQLEEALEVLRDNAKEVKCGLYMAPDMSAYKDLSEDAEIKDYERFQQENISLALQLCRIWLHNFDKDLNERKWVDAFSSEIIPFLEPLIPDADIVVPAVKSTFWAGRIQIIKRQNVTYYLDGAHTVDSMKVCSEWFKKKSAAEIKDTLPHQKVVKILLFNVTHKRHPHNMMLHLKECGFDFAIFTPNTCYSDEVIEDQKKLAGTSNVTENNKHEWLKLQKRIPDQQGGGGGDICDETPLSASVQETPNTEIFNSISEALFWCSKGKDDDLRSRKLLTIKDIPFGLKEADHVQVLITGSVYLVGGVLTIFNSAV